MIMLLLLLLLLYGIELDAGKVGGVWVGAGGQRHRARAHSNSKQEQSATQHVMTRRVKRVSIAEKVFRARGEITPLST